MLLNLLVNEKLNYFLSLEFRLKIINKYQKINYIKLLPPELLFKVLSYLDIKDLIILPKMENPSGLLRQPQYQRLYTDPYFIKRIPLRKIKNIAKLKKISNNLYLLGGIIKYRKDIRNRVLSNFYVWAIKNNQIQVVKTFIDNRIAIVTNKPTALIRAVKENYLEMVGLLLNETQIDPSILKKLAIIDASFKGHVEMVRLLLQNPKVDPKMTESSGLLRRLRRPADQNNSSIRQASHNRYIEVVRLLLQDSTMTSSSGLLRQPRVDPKLV